MTAQEYISAQLSALSEAEKPPTLTDDDELAGAIMKALLSRKFRKYAAGAVLLEHMQAAIRLNIRNGDPINLTFLNGAYKLWRLEESPEVDWAEFFTVLHYTKWVKPVCALYKPGVWFDFFEDDLIVPGLNHMTTNDVDAYLASFQKMLDFVRPYQPNNLKMTLTRVGSKFASAEEFHASVEQNVRKVSESLPEGLPVLTAKQIAMIDLNVKATPEEMTDPKWREKLYMLHDGYSLSKRGTGYHYTPSKILVFTQPLASGLALAVGTVRSSVAKFWIGVGVLSPKGGGFYPMVLTPGQLAASSHAWEAVKFDGLEGKNFSRIRIAKQG